MFSHLRSIFAIALSASMSKAHRRVARSNAPSSTATAPALPAQHRQWRRCLSHHRRTVRHASHARRADMCRCVVHHWYHRLDNRQHWLGGLAIVCEWKFNRKFQLEQLFFFSSLKLLPISIDIVHGTGSRCRRACCAIKADWTTTYLWTNTTFVGNSEKSDSSV